MDEDMIEERYILLETALLARELGFTNYMDKCYDPECSEPNHIFKFWDERFCSTDERMKRLVNAPTQTILADWVRTYGIHVEIYCNASGWGYILTKLNGTTIKEIRDDVFFDSDKTALEVGLVESLKLIKEKFNLMK